MTHGIVRVVPINQYWSCRQDHPFLMFGRTREFTWRKKPLVIFIEPQNKEDENLKKIVCIVAAMLLLTGCSASNGIGFSAQKETSPSPEVVEIESISPTPEITPVLTPSPSPTPSPTPRLYGRLSTMTLKESIDELIKLGADITNIVEYDEAAAAESASGKLEAFTQRIDFTLNGKYDCIAEAFASVDAATVRAEYYSRISDTAAVGCYVYRHDLVVVRIKDTAKLEEAEAFNALLTQVDQ